MTILKKIINWLLGKTNIDEKVLEAKETVTEKVAETKVYIKNVEKEVVDVVDAVAGKKQKPEVAPAEPVVKETKAFETPIAKPKPKKKYYKKKNASKTTKTTKK